MSIGEGRLLLFRGSGLVVGSGVPRTIWSNVTSLKPFPMYAATKSFDVRNMDSAWHINGACSPGKFDAREYKFKTELCISERRLSKSELSCLRLVDSIGSSIAAALDADFAFGMSESGNGIGGIYQLYQHAVIEVKTCKSLPGTPSSNAPRAANRPLSPQELLRAIESRY